MQRASVRLRFLVELDSTWKATDGSCDQMDYPAGVVSVSNISAGVDPLTKHVTVGEAIVVLDELVIRPILVANRLAGKKIQIWIGAAELAEGDFLEYKMGLAENPKPDLAARTVSISTMDATKIPLDNEIRGGWTNQHPLQAITSIYTAADVPAALVDSAGSWDPANYLGSPHAISHWNIHKAGSAQVQGAPERQDLGIGPNPVKALNIVGDLTKLLPGFAATQEDGKIYFHLIDRASSSVRDWTESEIIDLRQVEFDRYLVNRFVVSFAQGLTTEDLNIEKNMTNSQGTRSFDGIVDRIIAHHIKANWVNGSARLKTSFAAADPTMTVIGGTAIGMTGNAQGNLVAAGFSRPAYTTLSAARPAYLAILEGQEELDIEVVKATSVTIPVTPPGAYRTFDRFGEPVFVDGGSEVIYGGLTRAIIGSTKTLVPANRRVYDATIPYELAYELGRLLGDGPEVVEVDTPIGEFAVQVGDTVTATYNRVMGYLIDGVTAATKWIVLSKDVKPEEGIVTWLLLELRTDAVVETEAIGMAVGAGRDVARDLAPRAEPVNVSVIDGFAFTEVGSPSLVGRIDAGVLSGVATQTPMLQKIERTYTASKDTWVALDTQTASYRFVEVALGAAEPLLMGPEIWLYVVTTDGSEITEAKGLFPTASIGVSEAWRSGLDGGNFDFSVWDRS